ncbi:MAG TPA: phenylphosphate carboxylase subunit gamma [Candidatus Binatia bacterium]|nr:phenylphosphate carboxylase subunit gamma [Candidatus Binatia bacterium]
MASRIEKQIWETFVRRPGDLKDGVEMPMVLRDLNPGREKYRMRHVVAVASRDPKAASMDLLRVRTVVGVLLPETWSVRIVRELPIELPGRPYHDFYEALRNAATGL